MMASMVSSSSSSKRSPLLVAVALLVMNMATNGVVVEGAPTTCPGSFSSIVGYSDWNTLVTDLDLFATFDGSVAASAAVFTICPQTTFDLQQQPPISMFANRDVAAMTIQCGLDGKSSNNCVITGGQNHVWIDQSSSFLTFRGIQFRGAKQGSIWTGIGQDYITFDDCIWEGNQYDDETTETGASTTCQTGCSAVLGGQHGSVSFTNCQFLNNTGYTGAIAGMGMAFNFQKCLFEGNTATWRMLNDQPTGSAITLVDPESTLSLQDCCFLDNDSLGSATVSLDNSVPNLVSSSIRTYFARVIVTNENNYFLHNHVAKSLWDRPYSYCHDGIYQFMDNGVADECVVGTAACCAVFYGDQCPTAEDAGGSPPGQQPPPQEDKTFGGAGGGDRGIKLELTSSAAVAALMTSLATTFTVAVASAIVCLASGLAL